MVFKSRISHRGNYYYLQGDFATAAEADHRADYLSLHWWSKYYRTEFEIEPDLDDEGNYRWLLYMRKWRRPFDITRSPLKQYQSPVRYGRWRKY